MHIFSSRYKFLDMNTSNYQGLKLAILNLTDLSKDAVHIHIGLVVFTVLFWKKGALKPIGPHHIRRHIFHVKMN